MTRARATRFRTTRIFIPDYLDIENLIVENEKPKFNSWYSEPASISKLFRLLLFIGNDDSKNKHEIGQSSRSLTALGVWLARYDYQKHKWILPSKGAIQGWIKKLVNEGVLDSNFDSLNLFLLVKEFKKYCNLRDAGLVCQEKVKAPFKPPLSPPEIKANEDLKKGVQADYKLTKDNTITKLKENSLKENQQPISQEPKRERLTKAPDHFDSGLLTKWANKKGISKTDLENHIDNCLIHFKSSGKMKASWRATIQNWINRSDQFKPKLSKYESNQKLFKKHIYDGRETKKEIHTLGIIHVDSKL